MAPTPTTQPAATHAPARTVDVALDAGAHLGEGALWHDGRLLWVDIQRGLIHRFDPATGRDETRDMSGKVGTVVPRASGGLVAAVDRSLVAVDCTPADLTAGGTRILAEPERERPDNRMNDGKCDPSGRFFAGSMPLNATTKGAGSLFRLDPDLALTRLLQGVTISNGLAWSADHERFFYVDTPTGRIDVFDYDIDTGSISGRRTLAEIPNGMGSPDGMTIDEHDDLWVAMWGGSRITHWSTKTGELLGEVPLPADKVTSCAFGGPDLRDLFITTANLGGEGWGSQPGPAGSVFVCRPGVRGVPAFAFAG